MPDFSLNCLIKSSPRRIFLSNILDKGGLAKFLLSLSLPLLVLPLCHFLSLRQNPVEHRQVAAGEIKLLKNLSKVIFQLSMSSLEG